MRFTWGLLVFLALGVGTASANVAPCEKAMYGRGGNQSDDWRSEATSAGPVGVLRHPLRRMQATRQGLVAKMPMLVEAREPATVTVSVPPALRGRVFLYYGNITGRDGKPTTILAQARGYDETTFEPCPDKPQTVWPGGIRIKGRAPVHLLVHTEGREETFVLRLGRPHVRFPAD